MATTTGLELIQRAQAAADMTDNFVTTQQWYDWLNVENRMLAGAVARLSYPHRQTDEVIALNGASQYDLPEMLAILGVWFADSSGRYKLLDIWSPMQKFGSYGFWTGNPTAVQIFRNSNNLVSFRFYPTPQSGSVLVRLIEHPEKIVPTAPGPGEDTQVQYPLNWEERIVLGMARRALAKEETINPAIQAQIQDIDAHIESTAWDYLVGSAPKIRNIKDDELEPGFSSWLFV